MLTKGITQTVVSRNTARYSHFINFILLGCFTKFIHQNVYYRCFKRSCQIVLMVFDEIGILFHPITQRVKKRRFQSAKTIIQTRNMRFTKSISLRIALTCQTVNYRSPRITKSHYFRRFINCFSGSIVNSLSQNLHIIICFHQYNLRITSGYQQTKEWKIGLFICFSFLFNKMR